MNCPLIAVVSKIPIVIGNFSAHATCSGNSSDIGKCYYFGAFRGGFSSATEIHNNGFYNGDLASFNGGLRLSIPVIHYF